MYNLLNWTTGTLYIPALIGQPYDMNTRLTNNHLDFVKHIEAELSRPFSANNFVVFSAFPSLGSGHFAIQVIAGDQPFLLVRHWEQDLGENYQLGIYNLDNVKIDEGRVNLSDKDLYAIQELASLDIKVEPLEGIILDGVEFQLTICKQGKTSVYHWRAEVQISTDTKRLIMKLVDMAGRQHNHKSWPTKFHSIIER